MNYVRLLLLSLILLGEMAGCATPNIPTKAYPGPDLPLANISQLIGCGVVTVNGQSPNYTKKTARCHLLIAPGQNELLVNVVQGDFVLLYIQVSETMRSQYVVSVGRYVRDKISFRAIEGENYFLKSTFNKRPVYRVETNIDYYLLREGATSYYTSYYTLSYELWIEDKNGGILIKKKGVLSKQTLKQ
jgi:hypothetical protein